MTEDYVRNATLIRVHDGDTITVLVDMGFRMSVELPLRLNRIDAPELNTPAGKVARDFLKTTLPAEFAIQTYKNPHEKYGRWLSEVWVGKTNINDLMVSTGHAKSYDGGKKT